MNKRAVRYVAAASAIGVFMTVGSCVILNEPADLEAYLQDRMDRADVPGMAVGIVSDSELVYTGTFGYRNIHAGMPVEDDTIFLVASVSKPVTASALMLLESRGELDLDDDVNDHMPIEIRNPYHPGAYITFRMLLTHTAGIEDNWDFMQAFYTIDAGGGDSPVSLAETVERYFVEGREYYSPSNFSRRPPGSHRSYSNMGYALIGYAIEKITGTPFSEFCAENLFEPLGMDSSTWLIADLDEENAAVPYEMDRTGPLPLPQFSGYDYPAGQLRTTVADLAKLIGSFLGEPSPLPEDTVEEMLRIQDPTLDRWQAIAWTYNVFGDLRGSRIHLPNLPGHSGATYGASACVLFDPAAGKAVIILTNGGISSYRTIKLLYLDVLKRLLDEAGML